MYFPWMSADQYLEEGTSHVRIYLWGETGYKIYWDWVRLAINGLLKIVNNNKTN